MFARRGVNAGQGLLFSGRSLGAAVGVNSLVFHVDQRQRGRVGNLPANDRRQRAPAGRSIQKQSAKRIIRRCALPQVRSGQAADDAACWDGGQLLAAAGQR